MKKSVYVLVILLITTVTLGFIGGDGSPADPYQISTRADLEAVNNDLEAHYILANDIDLSDTTYTQAVIAPDIDNAASSFQGTPFTGSLDGNGYTIEKLTIIAPDRGSYIGLFGRIDSSGTVVNLGIVDCNISGGYYVGGLCGENYGGTIDSSYTTGAVSNGNNKYCGGLCGKNFHGTITSSYTASTVTGNSYIGGLCGENYGGMIDSSYTTGAVTGTSDYNTLNFRFYVGGLCGMHFSGTISSCYATGEITGNISIGGLCGQSSSDSSIISSYATGNVTGQLSVGGLCGLNSYSTISSSYATGEVTGDWDTGGLCGRNNFGTIISSYATGAVIGKVEDFGGLCGQNNKGTITSSFWDTQSSGQPTSAGGTGKTTAQMQTISTFIDAGWDFVGESANGSEDFWYMPDRWYPLLVWQEVPVLYTVTFNAGDNGAIAEGEAVQKVAYGGEAIAPVIAANAGWIFAGWDIAFDNVTNDITVTAQYTPAVTVTFDIGEHSQITAGKAVQIIVQGTNATAPTITTNAGWAFIGWDSDFTNVVSDITVTAQYEQLPGEGTADNPYQISTRIALEAVNNGLSAHYILANDIDLTAITYSQAVIAPDIDSTTGIFQGTPFTGTFNGNGYTIKKLTITDSDKGTYIGLFGQIGSGSYISNLGVVDCDISGWYYVGGLCGSNHGKIISSYTTGTVTGSNNYTGGLCGRNLNGIITSCYATGETTGSGHVGGLCGENYYGTITSCHTTGETTGSGHVGGLCGKNSDGIITSSYTTGAVTGSSSSAGGLCGFNSYSTIDSSYTTSKVTGSDYCGGLCGHNRSSTIIYSYATGEVKGNKSYAGGLCGSNTSSTIISSYATGNVSCGSNYCGGLCGTNSDGSIVSSYATGNVSGGSDYIGGLCGHNLSGIITSSYATGTVTGSSYGSSQVGGLCGGNHYSDTITLSYWDVQSSGQATSAGGIGKTTIEMKNPATFTDAGWDFTGEEANGIHDFWQMGASGYPELYVFSESYQIHAFEGLGTSQSPYLVYDKYDLVAINQNICADYILINDIYLSDAFFDSVPVIFSFGGCFNGNSFAIKNLAISGNSNYIGFFGEIVSGASVSNFSIIDCNISGGKNVGQLCGENSGKITSCHVTGQTKGSSYIGGLCGWNCKGTIVSSCATGKVSGSGDYVGGLCGANHKKITSCHAAGEVAGNSNVGGLCGDNLNGPITSSYATSKVTGSSRLGGLCGYNRATIISSYSTGKVTGNGSAGGLCGAYSSGTILNGVVTSSFWDTQTSGQMTSAGGRGTSGTGKTTSQMQTISTFTDAGWDYISTWKQINGNYPILQWQRFAADFNDDDWIDAQDLIILAQKWLSTDEDIIADINDDGIVDFLDYTTVFSQWLN